MCQVEYAWAGSGHFEDKPKTKLIQIGVLKSKPKLNYLKNPLETDPRNSVQFSSTYQVDVQGVGLSLNIKIPFHV